MNKLIKTTKTILIITAVMFFLGCNKSYKMTGIHSVANSENGQITSGQSSNQEQPNVIFIICDDLNDYQGIFGGHPQAITPNIDKL